MITTEAFLRSVVTTDEGWFCLALGMPGTGEFMDLWYHWPDRLEDIVVAADKYKDEYNVYFSPHLYSAQRRLKVNVLPTRTIAADLDEADILRLPIEPHIIVQSSPGRHQGYWILRGEPLDLAAHEVLSRKLTYAIDQCDHSGWPLGHIYRLPGTFNHKYADGSKPVNIVFDQGPLHDTVEFELLPNNVVGTEIEADDEAWIVAQRETFELGPNELMLTLKGKLPNRVYANYDVRAEDRSAALWLLMLSLFRAGCTREQVYYLGKYSANNKFSALRYGASEALARDVLRAERVAQRRIPDVRGAVMEARKGPGISAEKRDMIANIVFAAMSTEGEFYHCSDNTCWYIRRDSGRPIAIEKNSQLLSTLLWIEFGLNASQGETTHVVNAMMAHCISLPNTARRVTFSYYDVDRNALLLHTGSRDVIEVTASDTRMVTNGAYGLVFQWIQGNEAFTPEYREEDINLDWAAEVFEGAFRFVLDMSESEALATMRVFVMSILFRNALPSRPILAFIGQPGAGKSTTFRRIYSLLYGRQRMLTKVTTQERFIHSTIEDPFIGVDNVDTYERWFMDAIAAAISNVEHKERLLYTNTATISYQSSSMIGLTAHNPKFGRPDVNDRLLLLTFLRIPDDDRTDEKTVARLLSMKRNRFWGKIVRDIQKVLGEPEVSREDVPNFRMFDFAELGVRIANALGCTPQLKAALGKVYTEQRMFTLEEEALLINVIAQHVSSRNGHMPKPMTPGELWEELKVAALVQGGQEAVHTFGRSYRNAVILNRKMWSMVDSLRQVFDVEVHDDPSHGSRVWLFRSKQ